MKTVQLLRTLVVSIIVGLCHGNAEEKKYSLPIPDKDIVEDKWFGDVFVTNGMNDEMLKVGGWGDNYYSLIKMPVHLRVPDASRIIINKATMNFQSFGSKNPTPMKKGIVFKDWTEISLDDHWGLPYGVTGSVPAPSVNSSRYSFDISYEYFYWLIGRYENYGLILVPEKTNNYFNYFRSSKNIQSLRPYIEVFYEKVPDFKLPMPGGKKWLLTVEAGGKEFNTKTGIDTYHTGHTYYSLDFAPVWSSLTGGSGQLMNNVPIYAAAGGVVSQVASNINNPNGWFVKIDHDYDTNNNTGFQTVYIHFKERSHLKKGDIIEQGDKLGIMGSTGVDERGNPTSTGTHLHMTFYFQNKSGTPEENGNSLHLDFLRMEGRALKDYKLSNNWRPDLGQWDPVYYESSNKP